MSGGSCKAGELPFYPNHDYIADNKAPECFQKTVLAGMAQAQSEMAGKGLLPSALSPWVLPNMLVEGRADYGFNELDGSACAPVYKSALDLHVPVYVAKSGGDGGDLHEATSKSELTCGNVAFIYRAESGASQKERAERALLALTHKYDTNGKSAEKAVQRWNGAGAGAANHLRKVKEMKTMLTDPHNREIVSHYNGQRGG